MPYTKSNGQAAYALDYQNEYMAARGTFWESGGDATLGSSSTDPIVNVGAVTVRIDDAEYSTGSETQVVLAENSGATPRKDLIVAEAPASGDSADPPDVHAIAGTPIDDATYNAITDENGNLVADPPALPEVQPPAGATLKGVATPLYVIYVPPGTTDSTDLENRGREDVRKEGVGVSDVLRSGDAVEEIEGRPNTVETTVSNAERFAGQTRLDRIRETPTVNIAESLDPGGRGGREFLFIPDGKQLRLLGWGATALDDVNSPTRIQLQERSNGGWDGFASTDASWTTPTTGPNGPEWVSFRVINDTAESETVVGMAAFVIENQ